MTLLSISNAVADEVQITRPATVAGNTADDAQKMLRYCNKVGHDLMRAFPWQALRKEKTFTSVATEEQTSILPADFDRMVPETFWDRTDKILVAGPISPVQWQGLKANSYTDTSRPKFAYRGDSILVIPTLSAGNTLAFEYINKNWAQSTGGSDKAAFDTDTDVSQLDEELHTRGVIYEWLRGEGQPWEMAYRDYRMYFDKVSSNERFGAGVLVAGDIFGGGRHFGGAPPASGDSSVI